MQTFRSLLFLIFQGVFTPIYAIFYLGCFWLSPRLRFEVAAWYTGLMIWVAKHFLGIQWRVEGLENIPVEPVVVLSKHASTWETFGLQWILPRPQSYVAKRELLWIPFFGWGFALASPITINRSAGNQAMNQMIEQGKKRLRHKFWIIIFPEGTRIAAGQTAHFKLGGVRLAKGLGVAVLPVAHNAGYLWPKHGFRKYPGTITVVIGKPIPTKDCDPTALTAEVKTWVDATVERIGDPR